MNADDTRADEEAVRLVLAHGSMLRVVIGAIIRDPLLAEDTFSDTTLAILAGWSTFDQTRPFAVWARVIARRTAVANLKKELRQPFLIDAELLEAIAEELDTVGEGPELQRRKEALQCCMKRLPPRHLAMIRFRYYDDRPYSEIAGLLGKTVAALHSAIDRIRRTLYVCINRELDDL